MRSAEDCDEPVKAPRHLLACRLVSATCLRLPCVAVVRFLTLNAPLPRLLSQQARQAQATRRGARGAAAVCAQQAWLTCGSSQLRATRFGGCRLPARALCGTLTRGDAASAGPGMARQGEHHRGRHQRCVRGPVSSVCAAATVGARSVATLVARLRACAAATRSSATHRSASQATTLVTRRCPLPLTTRTTALRRRHLTRGEGVHVCVGVHRLHLRPVDEARGGERDEATRHAAPSRDRRASERG